LPHVHLGDTGRQSETLEYPLGKPRCGREREGPGGVSRSERDIATSLPEIPSRLEQHRDLPGEGLEPILVRCAQCFARR
jgi:hypothetical protein